MSGKKGGGEKRGSRPVDAPAFRALTPKTIGALRARQIRNAKKQASALPQLVAQLQALLRATYPLHMIAVMAGWGLRTAAGPEGINGASMIKGVSQHHVELLQAIALTTPASDWGIEPAEPEQMQSAIDLTLKLADAFVDRRMLEAEVLNDDLVRKQRGLQERLRMHTQMVRNWGPYQEVLRILRGLYAPLEEPFRQFHGFGVLDVIAVTEQTVAAIEAQVNECFQLLKDIFRAADINELVHDFFARYPGVSGDPAHLLASLHPDETVESVRAQLLFHADRWLVVNSIAPIATIASAAGITEAQVRAILDRLSFSPGALVENNFDRLFLDNPVWTKPGIKSGDQYFFAFPQTCVSFLHEILRQFCEEAGLKTALERRRAGYLELETARIISEVLPGSRVTIGATWSVYETDILVLLDRTVLIVESKSATLSAQGLRGAPDRVRRHIRELIVDPSIQSARLEALIAKARDGDMAALVIVRELGLEPENINQVIRLSVTLDDLSILSSAESELKTAGWIPTDLELAATLNLADLACIADILPRPCQFLHYFSERSKVQKSVDILGFELDFLGLYLATGFSLAIADRHAHLDITAMSQAVDHYYHNLDLGLAVDKPAPRIARMFEAILDQLEARCPPGWTTMALDLLSVGDADAQEECANLVENAREGVIREPDDPDHVNIVVIIPPGCRDVALVFHVFPYVFRPKRNDAVRLIAQLVLGQSGRSRCVVVSRMIETWDDNGYDAITIVMAGKKGP